MKLLTLLLLLSSVGLCPATQSVGTPDSAAHACNIIFTDEMICSLNAA